MFFRQREFKSKNQTGIEGEKIAVRHLKTRGYRILATNYRCQLGEIDIVAVKEEYLVFVEVKTRNANTEDINPMMSITKSKRKKLRQLGTYYIQNCKLSDMQPRFDVVGITLQNRRQHILEHIENAF